MINAEASRGASSITLRSGGSEASAPAARVSIMRFTHSIWVTLKGISVPKAEPRNTINNATRLIVN